METKKCNKCGRELPLENFSADRRRKDGLQSVCKACHSAEQQQSWAKKKELSLLHSEQLKKYQPFELIGELRRRGYKGKLRYIQEIDV